MMIRNVFDKYHVYHGFITISSLCYIIKGIIYLHSAALIDFYMIMKEEIEILHFPFLQS